MTHLSGHTVFLPAFNGAATAKEVFSERDQKWLGAK
jgi:hypothetical protein